ncbi:hypothetical protein [Paenibacillus pabuli]|uniref:hypothetical protein n=1 Tax=Paenibacillus pabuli TaxID=1472 RepID=UPI0007831C91|nr:hypothetical protein [Paenibacillus pabuli]MEC0126526.1 hypothetical protein [Paenibacillus pabuli]
MIGEILLGVLGNSAYDILKKIIKKQFGQEDEEIIQMFITSIETTSKHFFDIYGDEYGTLESSFLSVQQNWEVLLRSIFYGAEEIKGENFIISGLGLDKGEVLKGANKFLELLQLEMSKQWKLDKILTEKRHMIESEKYMKETNEKLSFLENFIKGLASTNQPSKDSEIPSIEANLGINKIEFNKKYKMDFINGASINYMLNQELIYVEYVFEDGATAYYEVDYSGAVRNSKFPYPLEQYEIVIPEGMLVDKQVIEFLNGNIHEKFIFRWGKHFTTVKDKQGNILKIDAEVEVEVDHRNKKINIKNSL